MSILFHHYKELPDCMREVEEIESKVKRLLLLLVREEEKRWKTSAVLPLAGSTSMTFTTRL
jgi:hypothetical protein